VTGRTRNPGYVTRPERRGRNGHTADCPYPRRDPHACPICRGERIGRPDDPPAQIPLAAAFGHATQPADPDDEISSCPRCYAPVIGDTTHAC
jgi:hypothetical protein